MEMYICKNEGCNIAKWGAQFPEKKLCPLCSVDLVPLHEIKLDDEETRIINEYPYLIALPFQDMLAEKDPFKKINLLKDVSQNVVKYLALIVATEYFSSNKQSREINDLFRDKISLPSFGTWNNFLRDSIKYLESEDHSFFIPELIEFYKNVQMGGGKKKVARKKIKFPYTTEDGKTAFRDINETYIGHLIVFRNTYLGHGVVPPDEESQNIFNKYYPFLKALLSEMSFCSDYQMIKYENGQSLSLMGNSTKEIEGSTKQLTEEERVWLRNPAGEKMPLVPFFIVPKEYIAEITDDIELFVYEQFTGKRILFFSPERGRGESKGKILKKLLFLIESKSKEKPFTLTTLTEEILRGQINYVSGRVTQSLISERKVIKGIYQQREDAEISLKSWVKGRASVYFLASEAGGGKTNLLNEMNRQYLEDGSDTLFLRANRFNFDHFDKQLKHELNLAEDFAFEKHTCFQRAQDNPFLILIDGLNECNNPLEFLSSIKEFQTKLKGGSVKIVISWRVNTIRDLPVLDDGWESLLYNAGDDGQKTQSLLAKNAFWLKKMNKIELENAWKNYTRQEQFKMKFTYKKLESKDRLLTAQLSNPLLLRMFLELFRGKNLTDLPTGTLNLWELWYKNISKTEGTDEILLSLTTLMLEKEESVLLLDTLYDHPVLGAFVRDIQINNPYQQLLEKGILSQFFIDNEIVVSFTMEALFHYCLGMSITNTEKYNDVEELLKLTQTNRLPGIKEALKYILWYDIQRDEYARLNYFIGKGKEYLESTSFPLAQAFILHDIDEVLKNILRGKSDNKWRAILAATEELGSAQEENVKEGLHIKIQNYVEVKSVVECFIILKSLAYLEPEVRSELLNKIIAYIETLENLDQSDKIILHDYIGIAYYKEDDFKNALEYHRKALEIRENILGKDHPDIANSYNNIGDVYSHTGDYEKAMENHHIALEIRKNALGEEHPYTTDSYGNIGLGYLHRGGYKKALVYFLKSSEILEKVLGKEHPNTATSYYNIGLAYYGGGKFEKALDYHNKALKIRENILGNKHPVTAYSYSYIGRVYSDKGEYETAMDYHQKSLEIRKKVLGNEHSKIAQSYNDIGLAYSGKGEYETALKNHRKALEINIKTRGEEHPKTAQTYNHIGATYNAKGDYETALKNHRKALEINIKTRGEKHPYIALSYYNIGLAYFGKGEYETALENHLKSLEIREKILDKEHSDIADSYYNIGVVYKNLIDYDNALLMLEKSLKIRVKIYGDDHPSVKQTIAYIKDVRSLQK